MTAELTMLLYSTVLLFILIAIPAANAIARNGVTTQAGSRDDMPEPSVFNKRATRLRDNMLENMALFAPLVLIANAADISTGITVLGAQIFFLARIVHAVIYLAGWPQIRPLAWAAGLVGIGMIASALF